MRVKEILKNLPTASWNQQFTINRASIKKANTKLIDPFSNLRNSPNLASFEQSNYIKTERELDSEPLQGLINITQNIHKINKQMNEWRP